MKKIIIVILSLILSTSFCNAQESNFLKDLFIGWSIKSLKKIGLDVYSIEGENGVIALDWKLNAIQVNKMFNTGASLVGELKANGIKPIRENVTNSQDIMNVEGEFYFCHRVAINTGFRKRGVAKVETDYLYYIGFKPFRYESDNSFENVNYVFQPYVGFDIPFSDTIPYYWNKIVKPKERKNSSLQSQPVKMYLQYSVVSNLKESIIRQVNNRTDVELNYWMSLIDEFILEVKKNYFINVNSKNQKAYLDTTITYPISEKAEFIIKWLKGSLPPTFIESDSITSGLRFTF